MKLKKKWLHLAVLGALSSAAFSSLADSKVSIYLFEDGLPGKNRNIAIAGQTVVTGDEGAIHTSLESGLHHIIVENSIAPFVYDLKTLEDENLRLILSLYSDGRPPRLQLDSSHADQRQNTQTTSSENFDRSSLPLGLLRGQALSAENGQAVVGARIYVSGTPIELKTDDQGFYQIELAPGDYAVSILHPDFSTQTIDQITIGSKVELEKNFELTPAGLELEEFVVIVPHIEGSLASVIEERRNSASVTDVLGADQIAKTGDSSAAGALKRVTGLTLVDGKFIYVRGMGERYSSTLLNGATVPSPDPTRRVVPLDLFPTSVVSNIAVQKSFSVSMPGEFGGGTVDLRTRGIPDAGFLKFTAKMAYLDGTTWSDGLTYDGGSRDWTGFDDGSRQLPGDISDALANTRLREATRFNPEGFTQEEIQQFGQSLNRGWDPSIEQIGPNYSLGLSFGDRYELNGFDLGFRSALGYKNNWDNSTEIRREYTASLDDNEDILLSIRKDNILETTQREISANAFFTAEIAHGEGQHLQLTSLYVRQTEDEARIEEGINRSLGSDSSIRRTRLLWEEKDLFANQLSGSHLISYLNGFKLDWQYTQARARRYAPNERNFRFDDIDGTGDFEYSTFGDSNNIIFSNLRDDSKDALIRASLPIQFADFYDGLISFGVSRLTRDRDSNIRRFKYLLGRTGLSEIDLVDDSLDNILTDENIQPGWFNLSESTQQSDAYTAAQTVRSRYLELDSTLFEDFRLTVGARQEKNQQTVINVPRLIPDAEPVEASLETSDTLLASALTWQITDKQQFRISYGDTLTRPDFRELSDSPFRDPVTDIDTIGNPELQPTEIRNLDVRWEWYPAQGETFSLAWFKKDFTNPIETILLPGENLLLTLANADSAVNQGYEIEGRKSLSFVSNWLDQDWLNMVYISSNVAIIESEIILAEGTAQAQTNQSRPLQGQSPYTFNFQIGYDNEEKGINATLVFNTFGERITSVGVSGKPDIYEQAFNQLDFVYRQKLNDKLSIDLQLKNILDSLAETTQGDEITRSYHKGRALSLSFSYQFK